MAPVFGTVAMLKPGVSTFGLELRLIRSYENTSASSRECIFHDREGERIHVTFPKAQVEKFKDCLIEGNVYALLDFVVGINVMKYKTTARLYKIIVFKQTRIFEVYHDEFPQNLYEIKNFNDAAIMENIGDAAMFDVMGTIVSHYRPLTRDINGRQTMIMDLILEDLDGNTITATLWEGYAEEMIRFLETPREAPVGVIIQFCRPNLYRGEMRVSSLFNITKIVLNQTVGELAEFNLRYMTNGKERSAAISTLTSSSIRSISDEIRDGDFELKTISQIMTEGKIGNFWVFATILCVEMIGDWSYLVCKRCQKKIQPSGNRFFCQKCQTFDIQGKLRYKLTVRVVDDSGTTTFLMWDKESIALIGKTAAELNVGRSVEGIPPGLERLSNKKALFNIYVQDGETRNYTGSYSVARICVDREIIKKVTGEEIPKEMEESISINASEIVEDVVGTASSKTVVDSQKSEVTSKSIEQLLEVGQTGEFIVYATVDNIEDINRYSYLACKLCKKELDAQMDMKFFCDKCESFEICGKSRYKLSVQVSDTTASTTFLLWENQCMQLVGHPLADDEEWDMLPVEVEGICNKKAFFHIIVPPRQVNNNNRKTFDVVKVVCEESTEKVGSEMQGSSSTSRKGKERVDEDDALVNLVDDDVVKRKLIDEFAATTNKRTKRMIKKEKQ